MQTASCSSVGEGFQRMNRIVRRLLPVLALLVMTACSGASNPPTATPSPTPTITPTPAANAERFETVNTAPVFNYKATGIITIEGSFKLVMGSLVLTPDTDPNTYRLRVTLVIDGNSVTAPGDFWISLMRRVLEIDKFPTATFNGESKQPITWKDGEGTFIAAGTLELRGRKRPVEIPFQISRNAADTLLKGTGKVDIDLGQFDIPVPTALMSPLMQFVITLTANRIP